MKQGIILEYKAYWYLRWLERCLKFSKKKPSQLDTSITKVPDYYKRRVESFLELYEGTITFKDLDKVFRGPEFPKSYVIIMFICNEISKYEP